MPICYRMEREGQYRGSYEIYRKGGKISLFLSLSLMFARSLNTEAGRQAGRCGAVHMCPRTVHACAPCSLGWRETEQNWTKKRDAFRRTKFRDFDERKVIRGIATTSRRACRSHFDTKNRNSRINSV